jgi:hypothetical protein
MYLGDDRKVVSLYVDRHLNPPCSGLGERKRRWSRRAKPSIRSGGQLVSVP